LREPSLNTMRINLIAWMKTDNVEMMSDMLTNGGNLCPAPRLSMKRHGQLQNDFDDMMD